MSNLPERILEAVKSKYVNVDADFVSLAEQMEAVKDCFTIMRLEKEREIVYDSGIATFKGMDIHSIDKKIDSIKSKYGIE